MKHNIEATYYFFFYKSLQKGFRFFLFMFMAVGAQAQEQAVSLSVRVPVQLEFQKAVITYGRDEIQKNTAFNFGIESLIEGRISTRISVSAGVGYFRQRFNIKRQYDHMSLNPGIDSLPYGSKTSNYDYHLLRAPVGVRYFISPVASSLSLSLDYIPSFSVSSKYNGKQHIPNANQKQKKFMFFSHALNVSIRIPVYGKAWNHFNIEPYLRILHIYKKDAIFFEHSSETITRSFDAIGVSFAYQFDFRR
jgi:hypothetical protein